MLTICISLPCDGGRITIDCAPYKNQWGIIQFEVRRMDNANFLEELLYNIQIDLWNIEILEPGEFVQRLLCFPYAGIEERMMGLIRQAIHHFQTQRAILKYIYIIDKLLKVPAFAPAIHNNIIDIYSDLFLFLLMQRCSTEIEELKILRKFWVGKVHPYCLGQMKENIQQRASVDIDCGFKQEMINRIKNYYSTKLNLSQDEMAMHLPSIKKPDQNARYSLSTLSNQRYMVEPNTIYQNYHLHYNTHFNPNPNQYNPNTNSYLSNAGINKGLLARSQLGEQQKRKRLASQQTRVASSSWQEMQLSVPRKVQHREVIIDYKYMLSTLKRMNPFSCRECGLQFMTSEGQELHRGQHFKQKLTKTDKNSRLSKTGKLCSVQEWSSDKSDLTFSLDQFYISIPKQEIQERLCHFCNAPLMVEFRNNRWIYTNAATVRINETMATVHKSCQLALEVEVEEE